MSVGTLRGEASWGRFGDSRLQHSTPRCVKLAVYTFAMQLLDWTYMCVNCRFSPAG